MPFAHWGMIQLLWLIVAVAFFLWWASLNRKRRMEMFVQRELIPEVAFSFDARNQKIKNGLILFVLIFAVLALMRPQWGYQWQEVKKQGLDILVAVDVSKSMLTEDVKPNRLERSKLAIKDLLKKLKGDRIGLIAFAGDAFLTCPLTTDYNGFMLSLEDLSTASVPRGGTFLGSAIREATKSCANIPTKYKAVIIVTDGENLEGDPVAAAKEAKEKGVKIFCIGIGTQEGELVRVKNDSGENEFLKDSSGNFIKSRLNEDLLQKIALTTDGMYVRSSGAQFGLDLIYDERLSKMERREIKTDKEKRYFDRFQFPLALALLLLVVETLLSTRKKE